MVASIFVARPFVYQSPDGTRYEFGCGTIYPNMDDAFANDWQVQHHTEAAVRARGGALVAYRQFLVLDAATGTYALTNHWAPILLQPHINPEYLQSLELGARPLFQSDIDSFGDIERPPPETGSGTISADSLGMGAYRSWGPHHNRTYNVPTVKVYPGDGVSPPVGRVTDPDAGRRDREEREHFRQQQRQRAVMQETVARNTKSLPSAPAPAPRPITAAAAIWHDPRDQRAAA